MSDQYFEKLAKKASEEGMSRAALVRRILSKYFDTMDHDHSKQTQEYLNLIKDALTFQEIARETRDENIDNQTPSSEQTKRKFVW